MLFMMSGILCLSALPCSVCGSWYPALSSPATNTMRLFMWQHDIVGEAHHIKDCFEVCLVP